MENKKIIIKIMAGVIVLLTIIAIYSIIVSPAIENYIITKQVEAQDLMIIALVNQVQQNSYVQISVGEEVLTLVPYQVEQTE